MLASLLLAAAPAYAADISIFQPVALDDDLSVTTFGVIEDSRCEDSEFCFGQDRLIVAAVVRYQGQDREYAVQMGEPIFLDEGMLVLTGTATPAKEGSATQLKYYRLDWAFQPYENG